MQKIWQTCITLAAYKWDESKSLEAGRLLHVRDQRLGVYCSQEAISLWFALVKPARRSKVQQLKKKVANKTNLLLCELGLNVNQDVASVLSVFS